MAITEFQTATEKRGYDIDQLRREKGGLTAIIAWECLELNGQRADFLHPTRRQLSRAVCGQQDLRDLYNSVSFNLGFYLASDRPLGIVMHPKAIEAICEGRRNPLISRLRGDQKSIGKLISRRMSLLEALALTDLTLADMQTELDELERTPVELNIAPIFGKKVKIPRLSLNSADFLFLSQSLSRLDLNTADRLGIGLVPNDKAQLDLISQELSAEMRSGNGTAFEIEALLGKLQYFQNNSESVLKRVGSKDFRMSLILSLLAGIQTPEHLHEFIGLSQEI